MKNLQLKNLEEYIKYTINMNKLIKALIILAIIVGYFFLAHKAASDYNNHVCVEVYGKNEECK